MSSPDQETNFQEVADSLSEQVQSISGSTIDMSEIKEKAGAAIDGAREQAEAAVEKVREEVGVASEKINAGSEVAGKKVENFAAGLRSRVPDTFKAKLNHLVRMLSTLSGHDKLLMLIQYSLKLIIPHLHRPQRIIMLLLNSAPTLVKVDAPTPLAVRLRKLSDLTSDYRIFLRLLDFPSAVQWVLADDHTPLTFIQSIANLCYYPLEHTAFLASHNILPISPRTQSKLWLYACRFWAAYVILDLYRLFQQRKTAATEEEERGWKREVMVNAGYAPLTVHWSLEGGLRGLGDEGVGLFGTVAAVGQLAKAWRAVA
ncbi:hypothetical protein SAICODRAFT_5664 [Saitoella complicata NRRL Y-17804]|uniref:Uncharacterized protein n=1 Tax=Saitoella complicata (strain BCRC 22490 / CBS 7301 / JCM 7358 / NBRC 10748 / NRRL Y-17804) TaxID=698492 RepID=A0A0E9NRJ8_SAICN|nr:uncharacterized protein SAICODRAFT_5664 [Saitoella complicata NRRL Y-17804]ODQ55049.1 hypothetical protein SAICODRAFT_5664 [Saitoella complicata NRRL Y-17804]GAO52050.1 hypothetical protein G7K_6137-t1 [Saitoella complicata NRRL Y-17804]